MVKIFVVLAIVGALGALFAYFIDRVERWQEPGRRARKLTYLRWAKRHRQLGWKFKRDPIYHKVN